MVIVNGQNGFKKIYGLKMKNKWTWEEVYQLGRNSSDAGVRMECERIAVKIVKDIPLIENDIRYLNRISNRIND